MSFFALSSCGDGGGDSFRARLHRTTAALDKALQRIDGETAAAAKTIQGKELDSPTARRALPTMVSSTAG